ncbi:DUF559 domain-containing protein [Rathayibacter sp. VKM Ac-2803]|uniref:endonuclease domain-containing protein n=1 Tax=Rathayibacter sp. VKM Ac-2803 TaxID=2609256 RepID=UPI00135B1968|nr:DUF559 domain-containing protein [Rathayibacter sp. VKM Ac-2803]MWV50629.1 DUF559 domain-containing protein [Rathayibacter sp. VKM Ac-2803]
MQYGVHHIGYLRAIGVDAAAAARGGALRRIRRGWYASPAASAEELRAADACGSLTCISLLAEAGAFRPPDERLHLAITSSSRPRPDALDPDIVTHWSHRVREAEYRSIRTTREEALAHVAQCQPLEYAVAVIDSCLRLRLIDSGQVARIIDALPRRLARLATLVDSRAEAGTESITGVRLQLGGIECELQVEIPGLGRVDLVIDGWLILEVDSRAWHDDPRSYQRDRHRDRVAAELGFTTLRLTYADVMHDWPRTLDGILAVLARGRPH